MTINLSKPRLLRAQNVMCNNMTSRFIFFLTLPLLFASCGQSRSDKSAFQANSPQDTFVSINARDSNYSYDLSDIKDTVTKSGWSIQYLVKDDSTKYNDVYIRCTKGHEAGIFYGGDLLQFRAGFVPSFIYETGQLLFFWRRCATSCEALLVFNKDSNTFVDYPNVAAHNFNFQQILYVPDSYYEIETKDFKIRLADLERKKEYEITFDGEPFTAQIESSVDTVIFGKDEVRVKATILTNGRQQNQIKTIRL
jgi:hypothetical protein